MFNMLVILDTFTKRGICELLNVLQADSVLALDLGTGDINWAVQLGPLESWTYACIGTLAGGPLNLTGIDIHLSVTYPSSLSSLSLSIHLPSHCSCVAEYSTMLVLLGPETQAICVVVALLYTLFRTTVHISKTFGSQ